MLRVVVAALWMVFVLQCGAFSGIASSCVAFDSGRLVQCTTPSWFVGGYAIGRCYLYTVVDPKTECYGVALCATWCNYAGFGQCVGYTMNATPGPTSYTDGVNSSLADRYGIASVTCVVNVSAALKILPPAVAKRRAAMLSNPSPFTATCAPKTLTTVECVKPTWTATTGLLPTMDGCYDYTTGTFPTKLCSFPSYSPIFAILCAGLGFGSAVTGSYMSGVTTQLANGITCAGCSAVTRVTCLVAPNASAATTSTSVSRSGNAATSSRQLTLSSRPRPTTTSSVTVTPSPATALSLSSLLPTPSRLNETTTLVQGEPSTRRATATHAALVTAKPNGPKSLRPALETSTARILLVTGRSSAIVVAALSPTSGNKPLSATRAFDASACTQLTSNAFPSPNSWSLLPAVVQLPSRNAAASMTLSTLLVILATLSVCVASSRPSA